jgi:phosphatidylglycerol lysyltransferase
MESAGQASMAGAAAIPHIELRTSAAASVWRRIAPYAGSVLALAVFAGALWLLHRQVSSYRADDVKAALRTLEWQQVAAAIALMTAGYWLLTLYDVLALRHIGKRLPYRRVAFCAYTSYAFVHSFGFGSLLHATIRYRMYTPQGLRAGDIAEVTAFVNITFMIGLGIVLPLMALLEPAALEGLGVPKSSVVAFGWGALALTIFYSTLGWWVRGPIKIFSYPLKVPRPAMALAQMALSLADIAIGAAVLYWCLPADGAVTYLHVLAIFVVALTAAIISHVPGGVGVLEAIVFAGLGEHMPGEAILAGLLVFRVVYFLLPLLVAGILFGAAELLQARRRIALASQSVATLIAPGAPIVLAGCAFVAGAVLLFSNATPESTATLYALYRVLPLPVVEASHFTGSIVGLVLLLIADPLQRRSHTAWLVALLLLLVGAASLLLKGLAWQQAAFLLVVFLLLLAGRDEFYQRSSLVARVFTPGWFVAVGVVLGSALWLGLFSYKHFEHAGEQWWHFAIFGDASRFLRASVAVAVVALGFALWRLLALAKHPAAKPDAAALAQAAEIAALSPEARVNAALLGDKSLVFHPAGDAFLSYEVSRRSWVALGEPVGPLTRWSDLFRRLTAEATRHGGWPVFFGLGEAGAQMCRKLGFAVRKIGEEAIVPLENFSAESVDAAVRAAHSALAEGGCRFEVVEDEAASRLLEEFWPGRFAALDRLAVACVRAEGCVVVAGVVARSAGNAELSLETVRCTGDSPRGAVEFLFLEAMLWGAARGFRRFDLGLVPPRRIERRQERSRWHRIGTALYRHGELFPDFAELRRAKERFHPRWEPRFVCSHRNLPIARALPDIAQLAARGAVRVSPG